MKTRPYISAIYTEFEPETYAGLSVQIGDHIVATVDLGKGEPMTDERLDKDAEAVERMFAKQPVNYSSSLHNLRQDMHKARTCKP